MINERDILHKATGLDLMLMLAKLHKMGYGKLRWYSYISPTGSALRCHITLAKYIRHNRILICDDDNMLFEKSVGSFDQTVDIDTLAQEFIERYPRLAEAGRGEDPIYEKWYEGLLRHAKKGEVPEYIGEFFEVPLSKIKVGGEMYPLPKEVFRLISWNIDGLKAKWVDLQTLIAKFEPDVLCLQKVKHQGDAFEIPDYRCFLSSVPHAGVCTYIKKNINVLDSNVFETNDCLRGYLQKISLNYPTFTLFNCYVPYSNPAVEGAVEHRKAYDKQLISQVKSTPDRVILCGDMNIVHRDIDCWNNKYKRKQANFHDWERRDFERLMIAGGLTDTFRQMHPCARAYSYFFRNDLEVRNKNQGHRIDYFLASRSFVPQITKADILDDIKVSTNNPIILEIEY